MRRVTFIDTSVFTNMLNVPGKNQNREEVVTEFQERKEEGELFMLPVTTVIETGNHIAQVNNGNCRREAAQRYAMAVRKVACNEAPFQWHAVEWGRNFLLRALEGADTNVSLVEHASNQLGMGDLSILTEAASYRDRVRGQVEVWTFDEQLRAYAAIDQ